MTYTQFKRLSKLEQDILSLTPFSSVARASNKTHKEATEFSSDVGISSLQWCLRKSNTLGTNFSNSLCRCSTDCWKNRNEKTVMRLFITYYTINQIAAKSGVAVSGGRHQSTFTSIIQDVASLMQLRQPFCAVLVKLLGPSLYLLSSQYVVRLPIISITMGVVLGLGWAGRQGKPPVFPRTQTPLDNAVVNQVNSCKKRSQRQNNQMECSSTIPYLVSFLASSLRKAASQGLDSL